jgi:hypothetical protein
MLSKFPQLRTIFTFHLEADMTHAAKCKLGAFAWAVGCSVIVHLHGLDVSDLAILHPAIWITDTMHEHLIAGRIADKLPQKVFQPEAIWKVLDQVLHIVRPPTTLVFSNSEKPLSRRNENKKRA